MRLPPADDQQDRQELPKRKSNLPGLPNAEESYERFFDEVGSANMCEVPLKAVPVGCRNSPTPLFPFFLAYSISTGHDPLRKPQQKEISNENKIRF